MVHVNGGYLVYVLRNEASIIGSLWSVCADSFPRLFLPPDCGETDGLIPRDWRWDGLGVWPTR